MNNDFLTGVTVDIKMSFCGRFPSVFGAENRTICGLSLTPCSRVRKRALASQLASCMEKSMCKENGIYNTCTCISARQSFRCDVTSQLVVTGKGSWIFPLSSIFPPRITRIILCIRIILIVICVGLIFNNRTNVFFIIQTVRFMHRNRCFDRVNNPPETFRERGNELEGVTENRPMIGC